MVVSLPWNGSWLGVAMAERVSEVKGEGGCAVETKRSSRRTEEEATNPSVLAFAVQIITATIRPLISGSIAHRIPFHSTHGDDRFPVKDISPGSIFEFKLT